MTDYIAYFGTYTIDENAGTVTHHRQDSIQPGDSGDLVRRYEFDRRSFGAAAAQLDDGSDVGADQIEERARGRV